MSRPRRTALAAALLALTLLPFASSASSASFASFASSASLASAASRASSAPSAPYMGVDTWYAFGSALDEHTVTALADAIVARGLRAAGYRYLWLDAGWWTGRRDAGGQIAVDPARWPHGMAWLVAYVHSRGLLAGVYTDLGALGCASGGSLGHYSDDVNQFASWGVDAIKADFCGGSQAQLDPRDAYARFAAAIAADVPSRPMLLSVCNATLPAASGYPSYAESVYASYRYAPAMAASWRTGPDLGGPGTVRFADVLRNLELDAAHPLAAGGGHWNDPDYLITGDGLTLAQSRTQFTMWAMVAAPMMLSAAVSTLSRAALRLVTDPQAIAISQDPRGIQGRRIGRQGRIEVWVKPLAAGSTAVALLNRGRHGARAWVTGALGGQAAGSRFTAREVWERRSLLAVRRLVVTVPAGAAELLRISPAGG